MVGSVLPRKHGATHGRELLRRLLVARIVANEIGLP